MTYPHLPLSFCLFIFSIFRLSVSLSFVFLSFVVLSLCLSVLLSFRLSAFSVFYEKRHSVFKYFRGKLFFEKRHSVFKYFRGKHFFIKRDTVSSNIWGANFFLSKVYPTCVPTWKAWRIFFSYSTLAPLANGRSLEPQAEMKAPIYNNWGMQRKSF